MPASPCYLPWELEHVSSCEQFRPKKQAVLVALELAAAEVGSAVAGTLAAVVEQAVRSVVAVWFAACGSYTYCELCPSP